MLHQGAVTAGFAPDRCVSVACFCCAGACVEVTVDYDLSGRCQEGCAIIVPCIFPDALLPACWPFCCCLHACMRFVCTVRRDCSR